MRIMTWARRLGADRSYMIYAALAALIVLVLALGYRLTSEVEALRAAPRDNVQWTLSQVEVDLLQLQQALRRAEDGAGSLAEVRKRFDLFYSRVDTLANGDAFSSLRRSETGSGQLSEIASFLDNAIPLIDGDDATLQARLGDLLTGAENLVAPVRAMSLDGVRLYARASDARRSSFTDTLLIAVYVSSALILMLGVLLVFLRRQSEISLARARESDRARRRVAATVNASLDAIVVIDGSGAVIDWNDAASEMFGYSRDHALGHEMATLIVPEPMREPHRAGMRRFLDTGETRVTDAGRLVLSALRADGTEFPVEISIALAEQIDGPVFVAYLRDIAARRAAEQAVTEARDAAMAADRAKSEFLAVMSHEMRTPLNGVLGVLDLLAHTELNPRQKEYVSAAVNSGEILLRHINDVLDITRIEADRMVFDEAPVDLAALLDDAVAVTRPIAEANGNEITMNADLEGLWTADAHRVRQVLLNLLGNASKFTSNGRIVAGVRQLTEQDGRHVIEFAVNDSGAGIAPEDRERIFEDFITLDTAYDRKTSGSGLGLAISRRIVDAMGGSIGAGSSILGGARFWFRLPLLPAEKLADEPSVEESTSPTRTANVLVVEDNPLNRLVVREMLQAGGHHVSEAEHGAEGVEMAGAERFDLILMDVSMPVMDGVTATQRIRSGDGASKDAPIIGLTAHALPEERRRFTEAGMQDCLVKPVQRGELLRVAGLHAGGEADLIPVLDEADVDEQEAIDDAVIADLAAALSPSKLTETINRVCVELETDGADLIATLEDGDADQSAALAHRMAGSAALVGGLLVRDSLVDLELAARDGDLARARAGLPLLQERVEELTRILREFASVPG